LFSPPYHISHRLLANIRRITTLISELNHQSFPQPILSDVAAQTRELSILASSQLENGKLSLADIRLLLKSPPEPALPQELHVLHAATALARLPQTQLTLSGLLALHHSLTGGQEPGTLRQEAAFVSWQEQILYWPPDPEALPVLIEELLDFITAQRGSLDPILLAGIFHKQALILQPFATANGPTIRLATRLLLSELGLRLSPLLNPERFYAQNPGRYRQMAGSLGNYAEIRDQIDFTPWLEYFSEGLADELAQLKQRLERASITPESTPQPVHQVILAWIDQHGYISDKDYAKLTTRAKATRALDFKRLQELHLIERKGHGKNTYYVLAQ
jgi:Fic family protein